MARVTVGLSQQLKEAEASLVRCHEVIGQLDRQHDDAKFELHHSRAEVAHLRAAPRAAQAKAGRA